MDDRDKAEDRVLRLTESLAAKEKDLDGLRHEIEELKRASSDVPRLLQAFNNADRDKKKLEAKVVELQVAAARSSVQDAGTGILIDNYSPFDVELIIYE
jgi:chromosome segregation ATPase